MMTDRAKYSTNKNFIISQHYPGIGNDLLDEFVKYRNQTDLPYEMIVSAYGHTHSQQCDKYYDTQYGKLCINIMTGGGGGCCSENTRRGFYVLGFDENKHMISPIDIDDDSISCQYPCGADIDETEIKQLEIDTCCHTQDDVSIVCKDVDLSQCDL